MEVKANTGQRPVELLAVRNDMRLGALRSRCVRDGSERKVDKSKQSHTVLMIEV